MSLLQVESLGFSYGAKEVLKGINLEVEEGEILSILGENGVGKTTLLKCINSILKPQKGRILLDGSDLSKLRGKEIARRIAYVPQFSERNSIRVFEAVLLGRKPYINWDVSSKDIEITEKVIKTMGLQEVGFRSLSQLSGGELQKVMLARALAQEPQILLLDEPTSNLDLRNQMEVMKLIAEISKARKITILVVMHDINLSVRFSHRFVLMKKGKIFARGGHEIITEENIQEVYGIKVIISYVAEIPVIIPLNG